MAADLFSIAPMMDCTDRHFRYLVRLMTRQALLYTEMLTIKEILESKEGQSYRLNPVEHPIAIQLGGSDPALLAKCTKLAVEANYQEVNLNVGCPSQRVKSGGIGACLMLEPTLVAECISAMREVSNVPVTVKCRLGVDEYDSYELLSNFINLIANTGCEKFIIHARKAWLTGLSPKQNREIPPLNYGMAYDLKTDFPQLTIILNGGIKSLVEADQHLNFVDGVMMGRAIYSNPFLLADVDAHFYGAEKAAFSEHDVVMQYMQYVEEELIKGTPLRAMTRHLLGLFYNKPRASYWRKRLSCYQNDVKSVDIIKLALEEVSP